ncbi:transposase domain-containing protein [Mesorhizobium sp. M1A.F.Ca.ET.072.01.1.1]|nr:transposase domain-containing protein [Mesorhizobium sp. M1A.F.Ca.ET.072.01.1.1]TIV01631.1 MAG: transposase domain-containing protein [Mesorhizobium sp.]
MANAGPAGQPSLPAPEEICELNAVDPQVYLTTTLAAVVNGHKRRRIDELLPWNDPLE